MDTELPAALPSALLRASTFEEGATPVLNALLDRAAMRGLTPLRAVAQLRQGDAWQALAVVDRAGERAADLSPSASAWSALRDGEGAALIDVSKGELRRGGAPARHAATNHTLQRLRKAEVASLLALRLTDRAGALVGAVTVELGTAEVPQAAWAEAQALCDLLSLALGGLSRGELEHPGPDETLPVVGRAMGRVLGLLKVFAAQDELLLLSGETGVGKSRLAAWCHQHSLVRTGPLESVVLSSLPDDLQLPTLFGWKRGAFTGADRDNPGALSRAEGGTLFLDEIDKLSLRVQAGLLQLLESGEYRPVGATGALKQARARVIVGTNDDLGRAVAEGRFLQDLFFRINVLPVRIPPLSERRDEIPDWVRVLAARRHRRSEGMGALHISESAGALMAARGWPGNLRQLNSAVLRAYSIALADAARDGADAVTLRREHAARALQLDLLSAPPASAPSSPSLSGAPLEILSGAARALRDALEGADPERRSLVFQLADSAATLMLLEALAESGDLGEAYAAVGRERLVAARSHHKDFRRRMRRLDEVLDELEIALPDRLREHAR
jgi:DNA-binding NtrC family response regulator